MEDDNGGDVEAEEEMEEQVAGGRGQYALERCHGGWEENKEVNNNGFAYFCMACYVESGGEQPERGTSMSRVRQHYKKAGHKGVFDENHSVGVRVHLSWKRETMLVSAGTWNRHTPATTKQRAATPSTRSTTGSSSNNKRPRKGSAADEPQALLLPNSASPWPPSPFSVSSSSLSSPSSSLEQPLTQLQAAALPWSAPAAAGPLAAAAMTAVTTQDLVASLLVQVNQLHAKLERHEQRLAQLERNDAGGAAASHQTSLYSDGLTGVVGPTSSATSSFLYLADLMEHTPVSMMTEGHSFTTPQGDLARSRGGGRANLCVHLKLVESNGAVTPLEPHTADVDRDGNDDEDEDDDEPKPPIFPHNTKLLLAVDYPGGSYDGLELVCAPSPDRSELLAAGDRLRRALPLELTFSSDEVEELRLIDTRATSSPSSATSTSDKEVVLWRWRYRIAPPMAGVESDETTRVQVSDREQEDEEEEDNEEEEEDEPEAATTAAASTPQPRRWWQLW